MRIVITIISLMSFVTLAIGADDTPPRQEFQADPSRTPAEDASSKAADQPLDTQAALQMRQEMNEEIAALVQSDQDRIATLVARLDETTSDAQRLDLQRQISQTKQTSWRDILAIQLKYAERGGHAEQATELRDRIARLDEGLSTRQPVTTAKPRDARGEGGAQ